MAANVGWVLVVSFLLLLVLLFNLRIVGACDFMICEIWLFFILFYFLIYKSYSPDFFYKLLSVNQSSLTVGFIIFGPYPFPYVVRAGPTA